MKQSKNVTQIQATEEGFLKILQNLKRRSEYLSGRGRDGRPLSIVVGEALDASIKGAQSPEERKKTVEFLKRAGAGDQQAITQLAAIRLLQATNYILASQNIMQMFFDTIVLAADESPFFQNLTGQETRITYVAEDGSSNRTKIVRPADQERIDLRQLTTPLLRYKKVDLYQGDITNSALQTLSLAYDMANQIESIGKTMLTSTAVLGTFLFTGTKTRWPFVANSRIKTVNLPTTNDISLLDNGTSSGQSNKFRPDALKFAGQYVDKFAGAFMEGPLTLSGRVLVPGADAVDLSSGFSPTGDTSNPIADAMLLNGWKTMFYDGRHWTIVTDNTLSLGACYFEMNRKPLHSFLKPSMDKDAVRDDYATSLQNEVERYQSKVFGAYTNPAERAAALRVIYSSTFDTADP